MLQVSFKVEACLRISLAALFSFILAISYLPKAVPPSTRFFIGILGPLLAFATPQLAFSIGAALLPLLFVIIVALIGATALLCAATVGDGLFVATFALWTLWCTGLWHGPEASVTGIFTHFLIGTVAISALAPWLLVRDGFRVTQSLPLMEEDGFAKQLLNNVCKELSQADDCWTDPSIEFPTQVIIPGDGNFAGQTAFISFDPNGESITAFIPGGLWVVHGLWQWSGLTNALAFNRNFIIVVLWSIACVLPSRLLPPIRTIRAFMSQKQIPQALVDVIETIRCNLNSESQEHAVAVSNEGSRESGDEEAGGDDDDDAASVKDVSKEKEAQRRRLVNVGSSFRDGGMASITAYEPRLCRNPFECTWPVLKTLALATDKVVIAALSITLRDVKAESDEKGWNESLAVLEKCQVMLFENQDPDQVVERSVLSTDSVSVDEETSKTQPLMSFSAGQFANDTRCVHDATVAWLNAIHHPSMACPCTTDNLKAFVTSYLPWIMPMFLLLKRMCITLALPLRPNRWCAAVFLHSCKFTLGFTILVIMEVYWVGYRNFSIEAGDETPLEPQLYSGWHLLAYIFATTPSCEGSFKKGLQRALGTVIGGFSAWIGIIVCSGSYDIDADVNPYGMVCWLTVTTAIGAVFTVEDGSQALMGLSPENGYSGMYYILTQSLIIMRVVVLDESGTRDQIVVNRIVANLTGVAMAIIVSFIPPQVYGTDPEHIKALFRCERDALSQCLNLLVDVTDETALAIDRVRSEFVATSSVRQKEALFLLKDASKMLRLPIFKVDPRLSQYLESLSVLATALLDFFSCAIQIAENETLMANNKEWFKDEIKAILERPYPDSGLQEDTFNKANVSALVNEKAEGAVRVHVPRRTELDELVAKGQMLDKRLSYYGIALPELSRSSFC